MCRKCKGRLYREEDQYGAHLTCRNCGGSEVIEEYVLPCPSLFHMLHAAAAVGGSVTPTLIQGSYVVQGRYRKEGHHG